jgi:hypothetical protein
MAEISAYRLGFIERSRCSIEPIAAGTMKGGWRVFLPSRKAPYLGNTLAEAIEQAMTSTAGQTPAPERSTARTTRKKTTARKPVAAGT